MATCNSKYLLVVCRLRLISGSCMSPRQTPPERKLTSPPSSCSSTPPVRPRLPKHFIPTPFLPRQDSLDSPDLSATRPPVFPRSNSGPLTRDFSQSSEEGGQEVRPPTPTNLAPMKKSKGLKLFKKMQKKLREWGIPGISMGFVRPPVCHLLWVMIGCGCDYSSDLPPCSSFCLHSVVWLYVQYLICGYLLK